MLTIRRITAENQGLMRPVSDASLVGEDILLQVTRSGFLLRYQPKDSAEWRSFPPSLEAGLRLLRPLGVAVVCVYPGHAEGERERLALQEYLSGLRPQEFNVLCHRFLNAGPGAPECLVIQKQRPAGK